MKVLLRVQISGKYVTDNVSSERSTLVGYSAGKSIVYVSIAAGTVKGMKDTNKGISGRCGARMGL